MEKVFYDYSALLSHRWASLYAVIGARGRGKTYGAKKWLLSGWLFNKEQFIILRDTEEECKVIAEDNGEKFWGDVINDKKFKDKDIKIDMDKKTVKVNGEIAGFIMPVSNFHKFKGSQYNKVKRALYDEFIREKQIRFNGNRALQFLNTYFTVVRFRQDFRMILTANALDRGDTILADVFDIKISNFGFYKKRDKGVILHYSPNSSQFEEYQRSSRAYDLVKGTRFENNLIGNHFADEDNGGMFFTKRKPCDLYGIYYSPKEDIFIRVYESKDSSEWYASRDLNKNTVNYMRFTFDIKHSNNRIRLAGNDEKKILQQIYSNGLLKFENSYIMKVYKSIIGG